MKEERDLVCFFYLFNPQPTSNILETDIPFTRKIVDGMGIGDGIGHGESINKHEESEQRESQSGDLRKRKGGFEKIKRNML